MPLFLKYRGLYRIQIDDQFVKIYQFMTQNLIALIRSYRMHDDSYYC